MIKKYPKIGGELSHVARLITKDDSAAHFVRGRAHSVGQGEKGGLQFAT